MNRDYGVVVCRTSAETFIIATRTQCVPYDARNAAPVKLGDSVEFFFSTPNRAYPMGLALDVLKVEPRYETVPLESEDIALVKCEIDSACDYTRRNDRALITNNFQEVLESDKVKNWTTNSLIGLSVFVTARRFGKDYFMCIADVCENKNGNAAKKMIGFVYGFNRNRREMRIHVPNYPEDYVLKETDHNPQDLIGRWVEFDSVNGLIDPSIRLTTVDDSKAYAVRNKQGLYQILISCTRNSDSLNKLTTWTHHSLSDKYDVLKLYGLSGDFADKRLWVVCSPENEGKVKFIVAETQEQLGEKRYSGYSAMVPLKKNKKTRPTKMVVSSSSYVPHHRNQVPPKVESAADRYAKRHFVELSENSEDEDDDDAHLQPFLSRNRPNQQQQFHPIQQSQQSQYSQRTQPFQQSFQTSRSYQPPPPSLPPVHIRTQQRPLLASMARPRSPPRQHNGYGSQLDLSDSSSDDDRSLPVPETPKATVHTIPPQAQPKRSASPARNQEKRNVDPPYVRPNRVTNSCSSDGSGNTTPNSKVTTPTPPSPPSSVSSPKPTVEPQDKADTEVPELKEIIKALQKKMKIVENDAKMNAERVRELEDAAREHAPERLRMQSELERTRSESEKTRSESIAVRTQLRNEREKLAEIRKVASDAYRTGDFGELESVIFS